MVMIPKKKGITNNSTWKNQIWKIVDNDTVGHDLPLLSFSLNGNVMNSEITSLHRWIYMRYKHTDKGKGNVGAFPEVVEEILFLAWEEESA